MFTFFTFYKMAFRYASVSVHNNSHSLKPSWVLGYPCFSLYDNMSDTPHKVCQEGEKGLPSVWSFHPCHVNNTVSTAQCTHNFSLSVMYAHMVTHTCIHTQPARQHALQVSLRQTRRHCGCPPTSNSPPLALLSGTRQESTHTCTLAHTHSSIYTWFSLAGRPQEQLCVLSERVGSRVQRLGIWKALG